jgi:hypothetical protein
MQPAFTQTADAPHRWPQPPQLVGSSRVSTQLVPHCVLPPRQVSAQTPFAQTSFDPHAVPHDPQLAGS